jgi:hypothetical protein
MKKVRALTVFLALMATSPSWATTPIETEGRAKSTKAYEAPPWKHKFGLRLGDALLSGAWVVIVYENQIDGHWAIRPSIDITTAADGYRDPLVALPSSRAAAGTPLLGTSIDPDYRHVDIDRVGATIDCIYYVFRRGGRGTGPYLLAGLGLHGIDMKDRETYIGNGWTYKQFSGTEPTLSVGLGYHFSRFFGMEYKHYFSTLDSPFPENIGKNWSHVTLNFRFPVPSPPKGN